jgi:hypothetical protein
MNLAATKAKYKSTGSEGGSSASPVKNNKKGKVMAKAIMQD